MWTAGIFIDSCQVLDTKVQQGGGSFTSATSSTTMTSCLLGYDVKWSFSYVIVIPREQPETTPMEWNYPLVPQKQTPQNCRFHRAHANCNHDKQGVNKKWIMRQIDLSSRLRSIRWKGKLDQIKLISNVSCALECSKLNLKLGAYYVNINNI